MGSLTVLFLCFLCVVFRIVDTSADYCEKGEVETCYSITVFEQMIPDIDALESGDVTCNGTENALLFWTESVEERIQVEINIGLAVLGLKGVNETFDEYCSLLEQKARYNVSLFISANSVPNATVHEHEIAEITALPSEYSSLSEVQNIVRDMIALKYYTTILVSTSGGSGGQTFYIRAELNVPGDEDPVCVARIMLFSCWIKFLLFKIIAAAVGAVVGGFIVVLLPIIVCLLCALYNRDGENKCAPKKKKNHVK